MKRIMAIAFAAFALLGADGRDTAIYNGKLTSAMNANGMAITNAPTPVRDGDLVNKAYVDGIAGVTPGTVTNIANARIDAKVAPWAMSGQPKPEGISPSVVTNIASSAAVTNAGAVASAKAYADGTFTMKENAVVNGSIDILNNEFYGCARIYFSSYPSFGFQRLAQIYHENVPGYESIVFDLGDITSSGEPYFVFKGVSDSKSKEVVSELYPDDSPVVTSNMLNGVLTPSLAQKADIAVPSASGNFAALTAQGNLADSGKNASDFATASALNECLPKSGGNMSGDINFDNGGASVVFGLAGGGISFDNGGTRVSIYMNEEYPRDLMFSFVNEEQGEYTEETSHLTIDGSPFLTQTTGDARYELRGGGGGGVTPQAVTNIVTNIVSQAYIRQKLGVYLYVGPDNGIYVHVE